MNISSVIIRPAYSKVITLALLTLFMCSLPAFAIPAPVATYLFKNTLSAEEQQAPALMAVDPLGSNTFENATVYGKNRRVYHYDGNRFPETEQAGISLDTIGLIPSNNYSVELVFEFTEKPAAWLRILDVNNRTSDNGFYVEPNDKLQIWGNEELGVGTTIFTINTFHHVVLTTSNAGIVKAYLDGHLEFTTQPTAVMNIDNPGNLLNFFIDNTSGISGFGEFADGRVALIRIYDTVLSDSDVSILASNPFELIPGNCPLTMGYWKKHPEVWPVSSLTLGSQTYSQDELLNILKTPAGGKGGSDASIILAHQLIAAKLNIANGSPSATIKNTVNGADGILNKFSGKLPYHVDSSSTNGLTMTNYATMLDDYNNGKATPDCAP